jgi:hypothetical protein
MHDSDPTHNSMIDLAYPDHEVEVMYRDGTLWVNIDGRCRLRCSHIDPTKLVLDIPLAAMRNIPSC